MVVGASYHSSLVVCFIVMCSFWIFFSFRFRTKTLEFCGAVPAAERFLFSCAHGFLCAKGECVFGWLASCRLTRRFNWPLSCPFIMWVSVPSTVYVPEFWPAGRRRYYSTA